MKCDSFRDKAYTTDNFIISPNIIANVFSVNSELDILTIAI